MTCKPTQHRSEKFKGLEKKFQLSDLRPEGRLQFFFHCPQSTFPIRDVVGKCKKEPHIEKNAENTVKGEGVVHRQHLGRKREICSRLCRVRP